MVFLPELERRGLMLILSSPSGAGKTSISRALLASEANLTMSISLTTRPPRPGEIDGQDYYFVSHDAFNDMISEGNFLEYAKVFDNYYGTPKDPVKTALSLGKDILFDIDWQGTQQISQQSQGDLVTIFILPPSTRELERRLRIRAQDSEEVVTQRMSKAADELSHWAEYDYVVINENLDESIKSIQSILHAERLKRRRQPGLSKFVKGLRSGQ
jgi:guanylate kinase